MPLLCPDQRSPEWYAARKGRITASTAAACIGQSPWDGPLAAFNTITGRSEKPVNVHMQRGIDHEQDALLAYECDTGNLVTPTGLWVHPKFDWLAASPDGLVGADGQVETKCPEFLAHDWVPPQYLVQVAVALACTERAWCDFYELASDGGTFLRRVPRMQAYEDWLLGQLEVFWHGWDGYYFFA